MPRRPSAQVGARAVLRQGPLAIALAVSMFLAFAFLGPMPHASTAAHGAVAETVTPFVPTAGSAPMTPAPVPGCEDGIPVAVCGPAADEPPTGFPLTLPTPAPRTATPRPAAPTEPGPAEPCVGLGCLPAPSAAGSAGPGALGSGAAPGSSPGAAGGDVSCGFTDIDGCVNNAINGFFRGVVTAALNPLLDLLSNTLLTTPSPADLPGLGQLWQGSWQILLACYALLILVAGITVMSFETLQTRYGIKEIGPRVVVGFLAAALSLWAATQAITITNSVSQAVMGGGLDADSAGATLRTITQSAVNGGIFSILLGLLLIGMLLAVLVGYVIRVTLTVILVAGAPIALMFHGLPQTEPIAYWWWKAFGGCLAIEVVQSLTLITAMRVFLAPGGFTLFGATADGMVNMIVAAALLYVLFKIPFWVLGSSRGGGGRSLVGSLVRGVIAYKTFGLISGRGGRGGSRPARAGRGAASPGAPGSPGGAGGAGGDPYARVRATADGQYVLPLPGLRRSPARRSRPRTTPTPADGPRPGASHGRQLALPLGEDWPENRPVLGRDGQYRLPIRVTRSPRPATPAAGPAGTGRTGSRSRAGRDPSTQLELPLDPYRGNRPDRSGQYPLPLDGLRRVPRTARPAPTPPVRRPGTRGRQPELPFDPYQGVRPDRSGQYPLPLDGVRHVPRATSSTPPPARTAAPSTAGQLRLPLGLPRAARPGPAPTPAPPASSRRGARPDPPAPPPPARRRGPRPTTGTGAPPSPPEPQAPIPPAHRRPRTRRDPGGNT